MRLYLDTNSRPSPRELESRNWVKWLAKHYREEEETLQDGSIIKNTIEAMQAILPLYPEIHSASIYSTRTKVMLSYRYNRLFTEILISKNMLDTKEKASATIKKIVADDCSHCRRVEEKRSKCKK